MKKNYRLNFDKVRLGSNIRYWRLKRGIETVSKLAELVGCSKQLIGKFEKGSGLPSVTILCTIALVLNISLDELVKSCLPKGVGKDGEQQQAT